VNTGLPKMNGLAGCGASGRDVEPLGRELHFRNRLNSLRLNYAK
jgi:hypothetical protein